MHLPASACGRDLHHIKTNVSLPVGAALQILLGGQNQPLLLAGIHRSGRAIQHRAGTGLDLGKDEGVILI